MSRIGSDPVAGLRFLATASFVVMLAVVAGSAPARSSQGSSVSLQLLQGGWWSSCGDPAAEFVIEGSEYYGDFLGRYRLELNGDVLVLLEGLVDAHSVNVTHTPLSFEVLEIDAGKLVLRPMPGSPYVGDWTLYSCEVVPPASRIWTTDRWEVAMNRSVLVVGSGQPRKR